jgi:hypothetical protein
MIDFKKLGKKISELPLQLEVLVRGAIRPYQLKQELEEVRAKANEDGMTHGQHLAYSAGYLRSNDWRRIRRHAMRYLGEKCEFCSQKAVAVHHIRYPDKSDRGLESLSWLLIVCDECHKVLHGYSVSPRNARCALCRKAEPNANLRIRYQKFASVSQRVCVPCKALASGLRDVNRNWSYKGYRAFLDHWKKTIEQPDFNALDRRKALLLVEPEEPPKLSKQVPPLKPSKPAPPQERVDLTPTLRQQYLIDRRMFYEEMSESALTKLWGGRDDSDLESDEFRVIRSVIRRKMGLSSNEGANAELDLRM